MLATECTQSSFEFGGVWSRSVVARFDGGKITSNGGGLLLQQVDKRIGLLQRSVTAFETGAIRGESGMECARCWRNASTAWHWGTKT